MDIVKAGPNPTGHAGAGSFSIETAGTFNVDAELKICI